jgi:hypothetical protein
MATKIPNGIGGLRNYYSNQLKRKYLKNQSSPMMSDYGQCNTYFLEWFFIGDYIWRTWFIF